MLRIAPVSTVLALGLAFPAVAEDSAPLMSPAEVDALIAENDEVRLVDISSVKDYAAGHVPLAVNVPYHAWRGPEENPGQLITDDKLTLNIQAIGAEPENPVVVTYPGSDASNFGAAARVYWTLKSAGIENVAILNGGEKAWVKAGLALETGEPAVFPADSEYTLGDQWLIDAEGVAAVIDGEAEATLIDARPLDFFTGKKKHDAAKWAGTLAGALSLDQFGWFASPKGHVIEADADAILAAAKAAGWEEGQPIASFCNTGHWAATNWFMLSEIAGIEDVTLYPESLVGWSQSNPEQLARN